MNGSTNGDRVDMVNSKYPLSNGDDSNYLYSNGNSERSSIISSSVDSHDGRSNVNTTSSNVRSATTNRRTTSTTDVSIILNLFIYRLSVVDSINHANN